MMNQTHQFNVYPNGQTEPVRLACNQITGTPRGVQTNRSAATLPHQP